MAELYGTNEREIVQGDVGRRTDVVYRAPTGDTQLIEVKTFKQWLRRNNGNQLQTVRFSSKLLRQIRRDAYLKAHNREFYPVWVFTHAAPSQELIDELATHGIPAVIYGRAPKLVR